MSRERRIRRANIVSPAGVGAVVDILGESFVGMSTDKWNVLQKPLRAPRIAAHFGVNRLLTPPDADDRSAGIPYCRFPSWLFCGNCRRLTRWQSRDEVVGEAPTCSRCPRKPRLIPMRFVIVCGRGHLDDVDWRWWAHSRAVERDHSQCGASALRFMNRRGVGGGLKSLLVSCDACDASRDLQDIVLPQALSGQACRGRQPWQTPGDGEACDAAPAVVQRGASSVYFPVVASAIDIPPDSDWEVWGSDHSKVLANSFFQALASQPDSPMRSQMVGYIANSEGVAPTLIEALLSQASGLGHQTVDPGQLDEGEWHALTEPRANPDSRDNFLARGVDFKSALAAVTGPFAREVTDAFSQLVVVDRLREIRALKGFLRHTMDREVPPGLSHAVDFLPAIEVFGEGVFLRLDEATVSAWESQPDVVRRASEIQTRLARSMRARWLKASTPRRLLVHTLAHLLLRELSFGAGYSASSMRERLYVSDPGSAPMAGLLIYTAAGDSEGSLGGLARLGEPDRMLNILGAMLLRAEWCSMDPVCSEIPQGPEGLSRAACHACGLVPETSCTMGNVLLDRTLVVDPSFGFLGRALNAMRDELIQVGDDA